MTPLLLATALGLGIAGAARAASAMGRDEQRIVEQVEAGSEAALALLERAVNVNSGTMNLAGVREVGRILAPPLDELGFATRWIDGAPFGRAGHLLATRERPGRPRVLLIGHLDTVFEADSPFQRFERLGPTRARGPGIIDMKGGDVVLIAALAALHRSGALDRLSLRVLFTGDEERPGSPLELARADLFAAADWADVAIAFENGDNDPATANISRRGSSRWHLGVSGRAAHSSQIFQPEVGAGAIFEAARILDGFRRELAPEPDLTFSPGLILGGSTVEHDAALSRGNASGKSNVVASAVSVDGDLRTVSPEQLARAKERMQAVVAGHLPLTEATFEITDSYPPLAPSAGNERLLALFDQVSRDLGFGPVTATHPRQAGAADVSFTAGHVDMALDGIGLLGSDEHTVRETADLTTLPMQTQRAALLLYRLGRGDPGE